MKYRCKMQAQRIRNSFNTDPVDLPLRSDYLLFPLFSIKTIATNTAPNNTTPNKNMILSFGYRKSSKLLFLILCPPSATFGFVRQRFTFEPKLKLW
jgi:hypothetical protein